MAGAETDIEALVTGRGRAGKLSAAAILLAVLGYLVELRVQVGTLAVQIDQIERTVRVLEDSERARWLPRARAAVEP